MTLTASATSGAIAPSWQPPAGRYRITRTFTFAAAHHLPGVPEGHKCGRNHGHTWTIQVAVSSTELVGPGWVTDFADLKPLGHFITCQLDHRDLNEILPVAPTSENLAAFLADWCIRNLEPVIHGQLDTITVDEGGASQVEFRPDRRRRS